MPRPRCHRRISQHHREFIFKPRGIPMSELDIETLGVDELEAMRLADLENMYQEDAAKEMHISRSTFARIVASGRHKVIKALINKTAIEISNDQNTTKEEDNA